MTGSRKRGRHNILIDVSLVAKMREIEQNPPKIPGFSMARLEYLISLILSHKQDKHPGAYSVLKMEYMVNVIPQANEYLNFLRHQGVIEWINYCPRRNSRMYRLTNEGKTEFRSITDRRLINKIKETRIKIRRKNSKKYPELNDFIRKVIIDYEGALRTVESTYIQNCNVRNPKAEGRRTFSLGDIYKIQSDHIYIKVSKTNGRLDSNFTRLPSELLPHLTIDGNPLIELDIRNSQPFFAASILNPTPEIEKIINRVLGCRLTMLVKSLQISECEDIKLYTSLVISGKFYPFLKERFVENGLKFKDGEDFKKQLFAVFFDKNQAVKYSPAVRLFKFLFPNIHRLFELIKKDEYNTLAILLQKIESHTILERVAKNILTELPGLPFITRHDSILPATVRGFGYDDKVNKIMLDTIHEVTGLIPKIRIKANAEDSVKVENEVVQDIYSIPQLISLSSVSSSSM